nr:Chain C, Dvl3-peptide [Homo sapiens]6V7O_D Chain D, Dvl3-peptide [Homo sapiens]
PGAPPGRDLA